MSKVSCPYCESDNDISEAEAYWQADSDLHDCSCVYCAKNFLFTDNATQSDEPIYIS